MLNSDLTKLLFGQNEDNTSNHGLHAYVDYVRRLLLSGHDAIVPKGQIAIARDFAIVLNDDGHITLLGRNDNFAQLPMQRRIRKIATAYAGYLGLLTNGRAVTGGPAREFERSNVIEGYHEIKDLVSCEGHTVLLFEDGSVKSIDEPGGWEGVPNHDNIVSAWSNIKQIAVGFDNIMGLTEDGKVIYYTHDHRIDRQHYYDRFDDIVQIDCDSAYYGTCSSMVLHKNGTVSSDTFDFIDHWKDIVQISVSEHFAVGLRRDGRLEVTGDNQQMHQIREWKNIISVECRFFGVVAITSDGEILSYFD